jgi:ATP-dependent Zn protease
MYLSIDVGIKNLAFIVYDKDIIEWKVIELCDKSQNASKLNMIEVGKNLFDALETIHHPIETIIIENQIGQNAIRMKMLQGMITLYFISKGMHQIHYWNAGNKLKQFIKTKTTYSQRKKASVQITRDIIKNAYPAQESYFETHKKKDDLADCLLQLLDFLRKQEKLPESINLICNAINLKL